jgi:heme-degrading monooxygenase HmoA
LFARVATYRIEPEHTDAAVRAFEAALARIRTLDGFVDGVVLVAPDESKVLTVTYWDSRRAMEASAVAASRARSEAARAADGEVESSCEYGVALRVGRE